MRVSAGVIVAAVAALGGCGDRTLHAPGGDAAADASVASDAPAVEVGRDTPAADVAIEGAADSTGGAADGGMDGGFSCGDRTCGDGDICVGRQGCGPVQCVDPIDALGTCAPGQSFLQQCPATGMPGCVLPCPPPTYSCAPRPSACGAMLTCSCLGPSICGPLSCMFVGDRSVTCAGA